MYYKEFTIEKIKQNKLFSMDKPFNNIKFKNLLNILLNIDENNKISWIQYFNLPFFKEDIVDKEIQESLKQNFNKEESINMSEVKKNDNENLSEKINDNNENNN